MRELMFWKRMITNVIGTIIFATKEDFILGGMVLNQHDWFDCLACDKFFFDYNSENEVLLSYLLSLHIILLINIQNVLSIKNSNG